MKACDNYSTFMLTTYICFYIFDDLGEHDIFGEALSDSDDDVAPSAPAGTGGDNLSDDDSHLSMEDSKDVSFGRMVSFVLTL